MFSPVQRRIHDRVRKLLLRALDPDSTRRSIRRAVSRWKASHPIQSRAYGHARRARIRGGLGSYTAAQWTALKEIYGSCCLDCGKRESEVVLTVDHVIPVVEGGSNSIDNLQPLCLDCNCRKGTKHTDFRVKFGVVVVASMTTSALLNVAGQAESTV